MKFEPFASNRRNRRKSGPLPAPALVESLETRALLAAPQVLSPTGTISDPFPVITWEAVDGATSYDLWVSDLDNRQVLFVQTGLSTTSFTPIESLNIGRLRIWAKANFADGSTTGWGPGRDSNLQAVPVITGPVNLTQPLTPFKLNDTTPTIEWTSPPGARSFDIFFSDQTRLTSTTYTVRNLTPLLDADGNTIPDGKGDVVREEIRKFDVPSELPMGQYRVFMRTSDFNGQTTAWSPLYNFEVAPAVNIVRPKAPSFQNPALLEWSPVPGATHYEVWVSRAGAPLDSTPLYNPIVAGTTSYQLPRALPDGDYVFYVRARLRTVGRPEVIGLWSAAANFGTIRKPTITAPIGVDSPDPSVRTVTDSRPILEWTAIDKAARYEIWVDRTASSTTYLRANSPVNSYQFTSDILAGNYFVWVRAVSTTGVVTPWSEPFRFTATGGAPLITSPVNLATTVSTPTIEWSGNTDAASYEVQIAWIGVDFDYIVQSGITGTSFTVLDTLAAGTYRVWVRAIKADGTSLPWSAPVNFFVVDAESPIASDTPQLVSLDLGAGLETEFRPAGSPRVAKEHASSAAAVPAQEHIAQPQVAGDSIIVAAVEAASSPRPANWAATAEAELIEKLAAACLTQEWWSEA